MWTYLISNCFVHTGICVAEPGLYLFKIFYFKIVLGLVESDLSTFSQIKFVNSVVVLKTKKTLLVFFIFLKSMIPVRLQVSICDINTTSICAHTSLFLVFPLRQVERAVEYLVNQRLLKLRKSLFPLVEQQVTYFGVQSQTHLLLKVTPTNQK